MLRRECFCCFCVAKRMSQNRKRLCGRLGVGNLLKNYKFIADFFRFHFARRIFVCCSSEGDKGGVMGRAGFYCIKTKLQKEGGVPPTTYPKGGEGRFAGESDQLLPSPRLCEGWSVGKSAGGVPPTAPPPRDERGVPGHSPPLPLPSFP